MESTGEATDLLQHHDGGEWQCRWSRLAEANIGALIIRMGF